MATFNNLNNLLEQIKGARICSLRTKTPVRANKKSRVDGSPFPFKDGVSKLSVRNIILGTDYSSVVNNRLQKEEKIADFVPQQLFRGKGRKITKFICEHTETKEQYLSVLPKTDSDNCNITKSVYVDNETGLEVDFSSLKDFLPEYSENSSQGTDKTVRWQLIKLDNILSLKSGDLLYEKV